MFPALIKSQPLFKFHTGRIKEKPRHDGRLLSGESLFHGDDVLCFINLFRTVCVVGRLFLKQGGLPSQIRTQIGPVPHREYHRFCACRWRFCSAQSPQMGGPCKAVMGVFFTSAGHVVIPHPPHSPKPPTTSNLQRASQSGMRSKPRNP